MKLHSIVQILFIFLLDMSLPSAYVNYYFHFACTVPSMRIGGNGDEETEKWPVEKTLKQLPSDKCNWKYKIRKSLIARGDLNASVKLNFELVFQMSGMGFFENGFHEMPESVHLECMIQVSSLSEYLDHLDSFDDRYID